MVLDEPWGPRMSAEVRDTYPRLFSPDGKFLIGLGFLKNDETIEGFLVIHDLYRLLDGPGVRR